ncbi:Hypothetical predicted protein [Paramuricea clavata]|uniref:Uncharacterized protein n=1 Tax=Paramuricea clavata TaxID=317549 RepID=A0A7D9IJE9_PARCT|nr:Hypothetical predicted protein [Paramuricea clavata]
MWIRVNQIPPVGVDNHKWFTTVPVLMRNDWGVMENAHRECVTQFGEQLLYTPLLTWYDWESLLLVARSKIRFATLKTQDDAALVTFDYRWKENCARMCINPEDAEQLRLRMMMMGDKYVCVDNLLDYILLLED